MIELLRSHKVIICAGTGGVGKTSLSAALGVLAAEKGIKTLVLTIDPALRLAQALGISQNPADDIPVPGVENLWAALINPRKEFDEFVLGSLDSGVAKGLFNNRLYQQLSTNLNGSQEFTSLVRLLNLAQSPKYDLVILDTPPTQNAVDFLRSPDRIYALFQDSVIGWFANPERKEGWVKRALHRGTRIATQGLETVTGSVFISELKDFFNHIALLKERIARVSQDVQTLLHASTTGFLLVTGFDQNKLKEALEFQNDLTSEQLALRAVIVNRWIPEWAQNEQAWPQQDKLKEFYNQFSLYFSERHMAYQDFCKQLGPSVPVLKLPDFNNTVQGLDDLKQMAQTLERAWRPSI